VSARHRVGHLRGAQGRRKRIRIAAEQNGRCFYCRAPFSDPATDATFDHYMPYALWPTNQRFNLVAACRSCNNAKGDALPLGLLLALRPWLTRQQLEVAA
jgi:5-methylcytosine-specific restriction endonuclease McrA